MQKERTSRKKAKTLSVSNDYDDRYDDHDDGYDYGDGCGKDDDDDGYDDSDG